MWWKVDVEINGSTAARPTRGVQRLLPATPHEWMDDTNVLAIEHPEDGYRGYCVVMGAGGLQLGLAIFRGEEGSDAYRTITAESVDPESARTHFMN